MTLADEDTNSKLTDNANRAFQGNVAMRVTQPGGQLWNQAMQVTWPNFESICNKSEIHTQKKYKSDFNTDTANKAIWQCKWWPNLQSVQVAQSGDQNVQTMDEASYGGKIFYLQMEGGAI